MMWIDIFIRIYKFYMKLLINIDNVYREQIYIVLWNIKVLKDKKNIFKNEGAEED